MVNSSVVYLACLQIVGVSYTLVVLLVHINAHVGSDWEPWKGVIVRNGLPEQNMGGKLLDFFCWDFLSLANLWTSSCSRGVLAFQKRLWQWQLQKQNMWQARRLERPWKATFGWPQRGFEKLFSSSRGVQQGCWPRSTTSSTVESKQQVSLNPFLKFKSLR